MTVINSEIRTVLKNLSAQDFKDFGLKQIAYIRVIDKDDNTIYSIHSANGKEISVMDTLDKAILTTRKNDLEPVTVH
ncbi:MAG: hypothetical protein COA45_08945 [Zetaproteobacteria bacterium]|nr:MAG: hypothetical protein COA45_08945 [Zetaproteobacteria bacterium]